MYNGLQSVKFCADNGLKSVVHFCAGKKPSVRYCKAFTPGNSFPSKYSKSAPPPVEMYETRC